MGVRDWLSGAWDIAKELAFSLLSRHQQLRILQQQMNNGIRRYGEMTRLQIDNVNKTMSAELMLAGEKEPITISVGSYRFDNNTITLSDVSVSREWMNLLAQDLVANKPWAVPADKAKFLRFVL